MVTHLMIKKTMTITSLAILVAAISVVTTMTIVQADVTGDDVDISVSPNADPASADDVVVNGGDEYAGSIGVVDAELTFLDDAGAGTDDETIDSSDEITVTNAGVNVPDGVFTFASGTTDGEVTFTDGNADKKVQAGELSITEAGEDVFDGTATRIADPKPITVDIDGGAEDVWIELTAGPATLDDIVVTIDDIQWFGETGVIGSFECLTNVGATSTALFDKDTLEVTITPDAIDTAIEVHCDYEGFHGDIDKTLLEPCFTDGLQVKNDTSQTCTFNITYVGPRATITDTISAGWNATTVVFDPDDCTVDEVDGKKGKNKKGNKKSATGFTCEDIGEAADIDVTIDTRKSLGKGHAKQGVVVFKPTSCGTIDINSGAKAILLDENGEPVLGTLDGKPIVLDSTDPLSVNVGDNESDTTCEEA